MTNTAAALQNRDYWFYLGYAAPALLGFFVRFSQERKKPVHLDILFQICCSLAGAFIAYKTFPVIKKITIFENKPFSIVDINILAASYFGAYIVTQVDKAVKRGWKQWLRDRAMDVLAYTDKERKIK